LRFAPLAPTLAICMFLKNSPFTHVMVGAQWSEAQ
jgi:hypothetical protein